MFIAPMGQAGTVNPSLAVTKKHIQPHADYENVLYLSCRTLPGQLTWGPNPCGIEPIAFDYCSRSPPRRPFAVSSQPPHSTHE